MSPHVGVHRGRQNHGAGEGKIHGGQKIVGEAVGETGQQIGGGGGNHKDRVVLRDGNVLDGARQRFFRRHGREESGDDFVAGKCSES